MAKEKPIPKIDTVRVCEKCGTPQKPDKKKSTKTWTAYGNEKCECGGMFIFKVKSLPKKRIYATTRREKLAKKMLENTSGKAVGKLMVEVGYSPKTAKAPSRITKTKTWNDLLEKFVPDTLVADRLNALLNKKDVLSRRYTSVTKKGKIVYRTRVIYQPHSDVKGAIDMALKIKGRYAPQEIKFTNKLTKETLDRLRVDR